MLLAEDPPICRPHFTPSPAPGYPPVPLISFIFLSLWIILLRSQHAAPSPVFSNTCLTPPPSPAPTSHLGSCLWQNFSDNVVSVLWLQFLNFPSLIFHSIWGFCLHKPVFLDPNTLHMSVQWAIWSHLSYLPAALTVILPP